MKNYLNNALVKTTDYVGNALYEDQALKLFGTSEGRVVVDQSSGAPVNEYEYALSDHTGNTRVVFTASPETSTYKAEFEEASYTQDTTYFYNIGARYNHPDPNNTGKAIRLNNATNANSVGPGISIPVYPGDTLNMSVKAYYADGSGHGTTGLDLAAMTTAVAGAFGGLNGGTEAQQLIHDIFNEGAGAGLLAGGSGNDAIPSAYLNYLIFDKEFKMDTTKSGFVGIQSGEDIEQTLSVSDLVIEEVGYLYLYVSNESNSTNFVYFDDLSVTHNEGRVNQYSEYYPFGLKTEQSWERVWTTPNKYQYNGGGELNITTGNYETFYRPYDPTIGRFTGIDPLASYFTSWTPYQYAFNDPVFYNDPNGDCSVCNQHTLFESSNYGVGRSGRGNFAGGPDGDPKYPWGDPGVPHEAEITGAAFAGEVGNVWDSFTPGAGRVVGVSDSGNDSQEKYAFVGVTAFRLVSKPLPKPPPPSLWAKIVGGIRSTNFSPLIFLALNGEADNLVENDRNKKALSNYERRIDAGEKLTDGEQWEYLHLLQTVRGVYGNPLSKLESEWATHSFNGYTFSKASSPIEIPLTATITNQLKTDYTQVRFRWSANGFKYDARWHTRTPGAPATQGNSWVITRTTPGNAEGLQKVQHILTGPNIWTPMNVWQNAVRGNQNGTATKEQKQLLQNGHHPAN